MFKELFKSKECTAHHFFDYKPTDDTRVKERWAVWEDGNYKGWVYDKDKVRDSYSYNHVIIIQRRKVRNCQHQGCDEKQEKWTDETVIPFSKLDGIGYSYENFKKKFNPD